MLKGKYLYGCLAAGFILCIPLIAEAKLATNGLRTNGLRANGIDLNTSQITLAATNGTVRVEGGQLVIQTAPVAR
jgi:hypothetical protein